MLTGYLIFAAVLIGGVIALAVILKRGSHLCAWCHTRTVKLGDLPEAERGQIGDLIREEGMDSAVTYELCMNCKAFSTSGGFRQTGIRPTGGALAGSNCRFHGMSIPGNSGRRWPTCRRRYSHCSQSNIRPMTLRSSVAAMTISITVSRRVRNRTR